MPPNDEINVLHSSDREMQHIDHVETTTMENEQIRAMRTKQNDEINEESSVDLITYTLTGTIRKRKKYDVPLEERKSLKL